MVFTYQSRLLARKGFINLYHAFLNFCLEFYIRYFVFFQSRAPLGIGHAAEWVQTINYKDYLVTCLLAVWLSGWLSGWLSVWLSGLLAGWLAGSLASCLLTYLVIYTLDKPQIKILNGMNVENIPYIFPQSCVRC